MSLRPRTPRFEQVKAGLTQAILEGRFAPGDRLPSLRDLCGYFKVSLVTVQRAVHELKEEEWLVAASRKGVMVANPLPPMAFLMRLKSRRKPLSSPSPAAGPGRDGVLRCLIHEPALLPLFEWAAAEYAEAAAPCTLRFEVESLRGRDDVESVRTLEHDLVLLSSYAASRAVTAGSVTPADGMLAQPGTRFAGVPAGILDLVSRQGRLWGVPVFAGGPLLAADPAACSRFGIDPVRLSSMAALMRELEAAAGRAAESGDPATLFNLTFAGMLLVTCGHELPAIADIPAFLNHPPVRAFMEWLRRLARCPAVVVSRFDQWEGTDLSRLAVRHQPSGAFCREIPARRELRVLPLPAHEEGGLLVAPYCLCVSSRCLHPFEAWEWAARLAEAPFQARLAALGYDIPVNLDPSVETAFGRAVGPANAAAILARIRHPSRFYGMRPEDLQRYLWEIFGNELFRYVTGQNDYDRLIERVGTKTTRFLGLAGEAAAAEGPA